MKINKYTPPDSLMRSVTEKITDDGYAKELAALPETAKKKTHIIPYLTTAAAITLVFCATLYVSMGPVKKSDEGTNAEDEFSMGTPEAEEDSAIMDADKPITEDGKGDEFIIQGTVTNDNSFVPDDGDIENEAEDDGNIGQDENSGENADKTGTAPVKITLGDKSATISAYDSARVRMILSYGEAIELDCVKCTHRYTIQIDGENYTVHNECGNVERGGCILGGISVPELDGIVKNYIDIE